MAYQPLYATVSDNRNGSGHTSSLRGIVDAVRASINSELGQVCDVFCSIDDRLTGVNTVIYNYNKLREWEKALADLMSSKLPMPTFKQLKRYKAKVRYWQMRYINAQAKENRRKVYLNIIIPPEQIRKRLQIKFSGIDFSEKDLNDLESIPYQKFLQKKCRKCKERLSCLTK